MQSLKKNARWYLLVTLILANVLIWYAISAESRNGILTVAFLDVGQGDAIFIEAPNGNQVLIDGGSNRGVLKELSRVMPFYDRSIDVIFATHPDKDHIGGLPAVLERFDIKMYIDPGVTNDTGTYNTLTRLLERNEVRHEIARRGQKIILDKDVVLHILFPDRDVSGVDANDASIVAKLVYGETSFLLTGDSPKKIEKYIASIDGSSLASNVLKVGHHGSKTSSSELFIGYASPDYAVISLGKDNRYGHPHDVVLAALTLFNIPVLRTDELGTIIFESDGINLRLESGLAYPINSSEDEVFEP